MQYSPSRESNHSSLNLSTLQTQNRHKDEIFKEVLTSLTKEQKELPCKLFYNDQGSKLFEEISRSEEYYLTRTETSILNYNIEEIVQCIGENAVILEPGSGSSKKIRIILENLKKPVGYIPVDISSCLLIETAKKLSNRFKNLKIVPIAADYTKPFSIPKTGLNYDNIVCYYPGATVGNFLPEKCVEFLKNIASLCGKKSGLLIGIDLKKDKATIEKAYNDKKGLTAEFNLNILNNLNDVLDTDFNLNKWKHKAFYNEDKGRIEMHLRSTENQTVTLNGTTIRFKKDETIHTENSYKFSIKEFQKLIEDLYILKNYWTDGMKRFAVCFFEAK